MVYKRKRPIDNAYARSIIPYAVARANFYRKYRGGAFGVSAGRAVQVGGKKALKRPMSYTKTRTRKRLRQNRGQHNHAGRSGHSLYFSGRKYPPKLLKFVTSTHHISTENASALACSATQCAYYHNSILDKEEMNKIFDAAAKLGIQQAGGTNSETQVTGNGQRDYKVFIQTGSAEYRIMNNGHHPVELIIYCYKSKKDSNAGPADLITASTAAAGLARGSLVSSSSISNGTVTLYPSDSAIFRQFYTVKEQEKITLLPGESHVYRVFAKWNKLCSTAMKYSAGTSINDVFHYKGYTGGVLLRISGYPVHSQATDGNVALSSGRIDIVGIKRYAYKMMVSQNTSFQYWQSQATITDPEWHDYASGVMEKATAGVVSVSTDEI